MKAEEARIFLCHASEDKPKVFEVYNSLKAADYNPWLDKKDLLPGQYWDEEIPKAIKASSFTLIFFSTTSVAKRGYVQKEFKLALDTLDEIPEDQIFIIPVRLDDCQIPERFRRIHYVDLFEEDGFDLVVKALQFGIERLGTTKDFSKQQPETPQLQIQHTPEVRKPTLSLRSNPIINLSQKATEKMLKEKGFFDSIWNKKAGGITHQYEETPSKKINNSTKKRN